MNRFICFIACLPWLGPTLAAAQQPTAADLIKMDFEDLVNMDVEIQSAGKSAGRAMDLSYAAHVITSAEIRKTGVQTIPDALRLAPGVNVNQISTSEWAVGIRGSAGRFSRFVLVLVDGRIAYNNVFSGVNWDELNIAMDQIARIEVIRGPNAAAWGANAVNGIINIITRRPEEGQGHRVSAWGGDNRQAGASASWSHALPHEWQLGVFAHTRRWGGTETEMSQEREGDHKDWRGSISLGRVDSRRQTMLTADLFGMKQEPHWKKIDTRQLQEQVIANSENKQGYSLQASHQYTINENALWKVRGSAEHTERDTVLYDWESTNYQFDAELQFQAGTHKLSAGVNTRYNESNIVSDPTFELDIDPVFRAVENYGVYVSDTVAFSPAIELTLAARLDESELANSNIQPSVRGLWRASENDRVWAAVSQATTSPSRALVDLNNVAHSIIPADPPSQSLPVLVMLDSHADAQKDTKLTAVEIGYRRTFDHYSIELALFDFEYANEANVSAVGSPVLRFTPTYDPSHIEQRMVFVNNRSFASQGGEIVVRAQVTSSWSSLLNFSRVTGKESRQWHSSLSLVNNLHFKENLDASVVLRHSHGSSNSFDEYAASPGDYGEVDNYLVLDVSVSWYLTPHWQLELNGRNIGKEHTEALREEFTSPIQLIEPSAMLQLSYNY